LKEKLLDISLVIAFQTKKELMNKYWVN
jgi:hypothetical protein